MKKTAQILMLDDINYEDILKSHIINLQVANPDFSRHKELFSIDTIKELIKEKNYDYFNEFDLILFDGTHEYEDCSCVSLMIDICYLHPDIKKKCYIIFEEEEYKGYLKSNVNSPYGNILLSRKGTYTETNNPQNKYLDSVFANHLEQEILTYSYKDNNKVAIILEKIKEIEDFYIVTKEENKHFEKLFNQNKKTMIKIIYMCRKIYYNTIHNKKTESLKQEALTEIDKLPKEMKNTYLINYLKAGILGFIREEKESDMHYINQFLGGLFLEFGSLNYGMQYSNKKLKPLIRKRRLH